MNWEIILKELACPRATQDLKLNTKNRNASINAKHIQYGPLNLEDEGYWVKAADHWNTSVEVAKNLNVVIVWRLMYRHAWKSVCL